MFRGVFEYELMQLIDQIALFKGSLIIKDNAFQVMKDGIQIYCGYDISPFQLRLATFHLVQENLRPSEQG